ncbi:hypothetical protein KSC_103920 [Ktedonobacter sp. SOSP1-52]|uniref:SDR family oxidoreductase n=1 Tax=Ktedonobacter sp. SOSP1-52 TaxID=2778366 RepID=UPI001A2CB3EB|nr:SDR family oxidoreductase [Ktedonobacter sp. SOSP1-52]GHO71500.1 hypothetical protein KSC_103920 [Ktedonobacter sp. SOSP1-52]
MQHNPAKAALAQFARYLAQELGPRGITVNVVEPGPVEDTRMVGVLDEEYKQRQVAATPGAPGSPGRRCPGRIVIMIEAL